MFHLFRPRIKIVSGVLPDDRPPELKAKDYKTEELIKQPIMALQWQTWEEWKSKPENLKMLNDIAVNHQGGVGSCAAQASSLALAINNYLEDKKFLKLSAKPIYARRKNKPNAGMYMDDMGTICINYGTIPEVLYPTPNDNEINMSSLDDYISAYEAMAKALRAKNYFWLNPNIDSFANILSLNKPIVLTVVFGDGEFEKLVPEILPVVPKYGHAICALPNAYFTYNGKKAILIQNSWGTGIGYGGRQILTEDWFRNNRVVCGIWFEDLNNLAVFNSQITKPRYQFTREMEVGMRGEDIAMLQTCLACLSDSQGALFPLWQGQSPTGYFGGITRNAVQRFQTLYGINPVGRVGPETLAKLNEVFK